MVTGSSGTRCRAATAAATTSAIRRSALIAATSSGSVPVASTSGQQPVEGRQQHAGLAERGQHLLDVAQERRAGPDDQHAGPREPLPMGVEQVRRPVQRDRGLARARAALTTRTPAGSARITRSCSSWIVATMSRIRPVRDAVSAASSAPPPPSVSPVVVGQRRRRRRRRPRGRARHGRGCAGVAAASRRAATGRGPVERLRGRRPPVDQHRVVRARR